MTSVRTLIFDIETCPNLGHTWRTYEQNVIDFDRTWTMLSFAWKWAGERKVHVMSNWHDFGETLDDTHLTSEMWSLLDEADIVVAHHGDKFDIKMVNTRFLQLGLGAPSPFKSIDTKKIASRYFVIPRNSLDFIGEYLGLGRKVKHPGWEMWEGCIAGEKRWWDLMIRYNKQDVVLLEKVWHAMQSFESNGPNMAALSGEEMCPKCGAGASSLESRGFATPAIMTYRQYHCKACGSWPRGTMLVKRPKTKFANTTRR